MKVQRRSIPMDAMIATRGMKRVSVTTNRHNICVSALDGNDDVRHTFTFDQFYAFVRRMRSK